MLATQQIIRQSLETDVWTTAKLRLVDFLKQQQENRRTARAVSFPEAIDLYKHSLDQDNIM